MVPKDFPKGAIIYGIIITACISLVVLVSMQDFGKNRTVHEMYLSSYPKQLEPGEAIQFSITINNDAQELVQYITAVLINGEEKQSRQVIIPANSKVTEEFTLGQNFGSGEKHKIETILYDEEIGPESYGSIEHPYYVFFNVDVI